MTNSFGEILKIGVNRLQEAGIADARIDAELLMLYVMGEPRSFIYVHKNDACDDYKAETYFQLLDRRAAGEPLQYITGSQEFMGLEFDINESVLIPRQDTETLVETALEEAGNMKAGASVLDMCCGSGAIAVSMAYNLPKARITACDLSEKALEVTEHNAEKNNVSKRVRTRHTDMFELIKKKKKVPLKGKFDMIISNPPYVPSDVIPTLQREITEHEPMSALDGGADGLDFYRILAEEAWKHMTKKGALLMEIGYDQGPAVTDLLNQTGRYRDIEVRKDLAGRDRVVRCRIA